VRHETVTEIGGFAVVLMDSISLIGAEDAGTIIVCGSHGGRISGSYAQKHPPALVVFNDAGIGRREAGIASLQDLDEAGIPAAAISCDSARIGDALDGWESGVVSRANQLAVAAGLGPGQPLREAVRRFAERSASPGPR
jgi:hypothetical protein